MPTARKLIGSAVILAWLVSYVAVAAVIGDRISAEHWIWKALYFPIVGFGWVLPLRPLIRWMHAKDGPRESPDV